MMPAVNWKVEVVAPAKIVAEVGTVSRPVGFAATVRRMPAAGAGFEIVAVQVVDVEDTSEVFAQITEDKVSGAMTFSVAVLLEPLRIAAMVGVWSAVTAAAAAVNDAVVAPVGIVTDAGTVSAEVALLERVTVIPPVGAALERVTVQVVVEDAARVVFVHCSDVSVIAAVTVSVADWVEPLSVAVMIGV
jgi:hypothetical protein